MYCLEINVCTEMKIRFYIERAKMKYMYNENSTCM